MKTERMDPKDAARCRWLGYTFVKGVTHPERRISAWASEQVAQDTGLHARLVQGFGGVDDDEDCYKANPPRGLGFGGFIRWVRFSSTTTDHHVFGVDFSAYDSPLRGVATTMFRVIEVARQAHFDGIPDSDELVLLQHSMCEPEEYELWRREQGLVTIRDWIGAWSRFAPPTELCPVCGFRSLKLSDLPICRECGLNPHAVWRKYAL